MLVRDLAEAKRTRDSISCLLQLYHRFSNQNLMLTIRAWKKPPEVKLSKKHGANFTVHAAIDVYIVCNSTENPTPQGEASVCTNSTPLAFTLGIVSHELLILSIIQYGFVLVRKLMHLQSFGLTALKIAPHSWEMLPTSSTF